MNQMDRDKRAIRVILQQTGGAHFDEIALRGGEGLWPALGELLDEGEVTVKSKHVEKVGDRQVFFLTDKAQILTEEEIQDVLHQPEETNVDDYIQPGFRYEEEFNDLTSDEALIRLEEIVKEQDRKS